jgi:signal transduction histidine kinase
MVVEDRGPGIPEEDRERIFRRFERGSLPPKGHPGSGLGRYIARTLVRAMGGEIGLASQPTGGNRFVASFPVLQ